MKPTMTTDKTPIMQAEPIRAPAWLAATLITFLPVIIALLLEADWRVALAAALAGLVPASSVVAVTESRRARTDSPATVQRYMDEQDAFVEAMTEPSDPATSLPPGFTIDYIDPDDI